MTHAYTYEFEDIPITINGKVNTWVDGFAHFEDDPGYEPLLVEIELTNDVNDKTFRIFWRDVDPAKKALFNALSIYIFQETKAEEMAAAEFAQLEAEDRIYGY